MTTTVALQKCSDYTQEQVYLAVKNLTQLVPPPDVRGKTVLLKPNILYPKKPELAVCTHPIVTGACVRVFYELGAAKVLAGESPAVSPSTSAAKLTGMYKQVVDNGGEWIDFHKKTTVLCEQGKVVKKFDFAKPFTQADLIVSVAKLKSHQLMSYTGAMKNLFGLMIGLEKAQCHYRFPDKKDFAAFLTDLNIAAKASYAVMDAIIGMEGPGGPGSGDPVKLGFLAASDNILALDWCCSGLVGYNPHKILNLEDALNRKIWLDSPEQIRTVGVPPEEVRSTTFKIVKDAAPTLSSMMPKIVDKIAQRWFSKTPSFQKNKCIKCTRCSEICPAQIIKMTGKNGTAALTEKSKCLHCYCCHEICPNGAIKLRRF